MRRIRDILVKIWDRAIGDDLRQGDRISQLYEALEHDLDDPRYWLGGAPLKWWDDPEFIEEARRQEKQFADAVNAVFLAEAKAHQEGRRFDWSSIRF